MGGSTGIGLAAARCLARHGSVVELAANDEAERDRRGRTAPRRRVRSPRDGARRGPSRADRGLLRRPGHPPRAGIGPGQLGRHPALRHGREHPGRGVGRGARRQRARHVPDRQARRAADAPQRRRRHRQRVLRAGHRQPAQRGGLHREQGRDRGHDPGHGRRLRAGRHPRQLAQPRLGRHPHAAPVGPGGRRRGHGDRAVGREPPPRPGRHARRGRGRDPVPGQPAVRLRDRHRATRRRRPARRRRGGGPGRPLPPKPHDRGTPPPLHHR